MQILVDGNIDGAIRQLKKEMDHSGLRRETKLQAIPKKSQRRREKGRLAAKRRRERQVAISRYDRESRNSQAPCWVFLKQDGAYFKVHVSHKGNVE